MEPNEPKGIRPKSSEIKLKRKALGWTAEVLAHEAGLNIKTISNVESGRLNAQIETMKLIADALGCELHEIAFLPAVASVPSQPTEDGITQGLVEIAKGLEGLRENILLIAKGWANVKDARDVWADRSSGPLAQAISDTLATLFPITGPINVDVQREEIREANSFEVDYHVNETGLKVMIACLLRGQLQSLGLYSLHFNEPFNVLDFVKEVLFKLRKQVVAPHLTLRMVEGGTSSTYNYEHFSHSFTMTALRTYGTNQTTWTITSSIMFDDVLKSLDVFDQEFVKHFEQGPPIEIKASEIPSLVRRRAEQSSGDKSNS